MPKSFTPTTNMRKRKNKSPGPVSIQNAQKKVKISLEKYSERASCILRLLSKTKKHRLLPLTGVNFRFVDDAEIKKWHRDFLGDSSPTDVIAFSMREGVALKSEEDGLGDVVISVETARRQARQFGKSLDEELTLYMIHGVLHLLGYDDLQPSKKKVMDRLQFSILKKVMHGQ